MKLRYNIVRCIVIMICMMGGKSALAQYDPMFTQYMFNELFINPAYAGAKDALSFTALHRNQWVGIDGAPMTTTFSMHTPVFNKYHNVGVSFMNERIGVTHKNYVYATYAFRFPVKKGFFSLGITGGLALLEERFADVTTVDPEDPNFRANIPVQAMPNFGFGMYYYAKSWYIGLSIPRMLRNDLNTDASNTVRRNNSFDFENFHYYLTGGYMFDISPAFKLKPQAMVKLVVNAPVEFDINLSALIKEKFWLGVSYRSMADMSVLIGYQPKPCFLVSYSYDYSLSALQNYNFGSHEIALNFLLASKKNRILSPRYF